MSAVLTIAGKEIKSYFKTPLAYVIIAVVIAIMGYMFFYALQFYAINNLQAGMGGGKTPGSLSRDVINPLYGNLHIIFLITIPAITMNLFSMEYKLNTFTLLQTSPISNAQILFGKYIGALFFLLILLAVIFLCPLSLIILGNPDLGVVLSCNIAVFLLGASFLAIGIMCSSFTENQVISFLLTALIIFFLMIINWAAYSVNSEMAVFLKKLALFEHYRDLAKGTISSTSIMFYISIILVSLHFAYRNLEARSEV